MEQLEFKGIITGITQVTIVKKFLLLVKCYILHFCVLLVEEKQSSMLNWLLI